ncbi:MAG: hypothetical protein RLZZ399_973 [Verrucomicrobiota bacterium]|jgi:rhodanese-related sulfurtransferase
MSGIPANFPHATPQDTPRLSRTNQVALLLLAAALLSATNQFLGIRWRRPPEIAVLPLSEAQKQNVPTVWVDVRDADRFEREHVPGAVSFDETRPDSSLRDLLRVWNTGKRIVVYGEGTGSQRAQRVAEQLKKDLNTRSVFLLEGGWAAWPHASSH